VKRLKILDRYLAEHYAGPFGACVGIFSVMVILGRFIDKMSIFTNFQAKAGDIVLFLILSVPFWLNMVLPVATLLALLFSLGTLQQRGEVTAMRSAGIGSLRLFRPYFVIGLAISILSLIGGLSFLPKLNFKASSIYRVNIKNREAVAYRRDNVVVSGSDNRQFTIGWLDADKNYMDNVVVDKFDKNLNWEESITAKRAYYLNGRWRFDNGVRRVPDPAHSGQFIEDPFENRWMDIREKPADFLIEDKAPEDMTGREILRRIRSLRRLGASTTEMRTTYHMKIALPFANLIVILLGIPYAVHQGQHGRVQTFAYALSASFLYWGCTSVFQSMGEQGRVWPWMAAWFPNALFGVIAAVRFRKAI
jgi:lipopolysaccharide export system permease protein